MSQHSYKEVSSLHATVQRSPTPQAPAHMQRPAILVDDLLSYQPRQRLFLRDLSYSRGESSCCPFSRNPCRRSVSSARYISLQHAAVRKKEVSPPKVASFLRGLPPQRKRPCFQRPEILGKSLLRPLPQTRFRYKVNPHRTMPAAEHSSYLEHLPAWSHVSLSKENVEAHVFPFEYRILKNM